MDIIRYSKKALDSFYTLSSIPLGLYSAGMYLRYKSDLKKTESLRNTRKGEVCYVLGGGPSLKEVNLETLTDLTTIAVNRFYKLEEYSALNVDYHCAIDQVMFGKFLSEFESTIKKNEDTKFILSRRSIPGLSKYPNVYPTCFGLAPSRYIHPYDISRPSASFVNVVLFAIECAIFMGFRRIVLLGCDFNQFAVQVESHVYEEGSLKRQAPLFGDLLGHAIALMQHEYLLEFSRARGVEIINATRGSRLDVYENIDLEPLFYK